MWPQLLRSARTGPARRACATIRTDLRKRADRMTDPETFREASGTQRLLGYVLDVGRPDRRARCSLLVEERHLNRQGILHGGIATTLLDTACGATAALSADDSGRQPVATLSLTVDFIAPGRAGMTLTAIGRICGGGRTTLFVDGELSDQDGRLIATASGVFRRARVATGPRE